MAWVIFKPSDRLVEAAVPNEAIATARVAALGGTTTSIEVDDGEGGNSLPDWFYVGCYVDAGGVLSADAPMPDVDRLQWAARGATDALVGLSRGARDLVGRVYASQEYAPRPRLGRVGAPRPCPRVPVHTLDHRPTGGVL